MPRLPNGARAPVKKKKPAPKRKPSTPIYEGKVVKKKPSSPVRPGKSALAAQARKKTSVKAKPKKELTADQLFRQQTKEMYKGINERAAKRTPAAAVAAVKKATASKRKKMGNESDWEKGLRVRNWARGQKIGGR